MSAVALVYTLFGSREAALGMARQLIEERLIGCANLLGEATSLYEWNGVLEETAEVPVLFKTTPSRRDALMERIAQLHDYEVPAILALPVEAADNAFAKWVGDQLAK
ncbi:divalent-cation tolerance protein CutA [Sphingobium estronivorans]|uniref:divalent-cation tolerance protein CutA n=1 Tax=Sphingobium estronivorans TaxID=1577690 RepID=UPI00123C2061|nr:divalent-cation tolerance protein CutA [Sphingobium estronivorans]